MTERKRLVLNLFEMNCVSHITHGLWRLPDNNRERYNDIEYWIELAQLLEAGGFDAVFLADVVGTYDMFRGVADTAIRQGLQIPNNDPASSYRRWRRSPSTSASASPSRRPTSRRSPGRAGLSTLDHLTKGRVGWNIVTSYLPNAARNYGLEGEVEHDNRFERADEYLDVLYKLWEGSWDDDAIVADREHNVYADPAKIRPIDHDGTYFKVEGPHLPSPQPAAHACALHGHAVARPAPRSPASTPRSSSPAGRARSSCKEHGRLAQAGGRRRGRRSATSR